MQRFREACGAKLLSCRTNPKAAVLLTLAAAACLLLTWYSGVIPKLKGENAIASGPIILPALSRKPSNWTLGTSENKSPRVLKTRRIKLPIAIVGGFPRRALDDLAAYSLHTEDQAGHLKCSDIVHKEQCQRTEGCIFSESEKSSACMVNETDTTECHDILNNEDCWRAEGCAFD